MCYTQHEQACTPAYRGWRLCKELACVRRVEPYDVPSSERPKAGVLSMGIDAAEHGFQVFVARLHPGIHHIAHLWVKHVLTTFDSVLQQLVVGVR